MINTETLLNRIAEVKQITNGIYVKNGGFNPTNLETAIQGCLSLIRITNQSNNTHAELLLKTRESYYRSYNDDSIYNIVYYINAYCDNLKADIECGFIGNIQKQAVGEVFGDFISLAKQLLETDNKDAAAVLACGALEDSLKRFAINNELDCYDSELSQVVNALKSKSLLKGPQASLVSSYVALRNKAFHAQFDKIEVPEVKSLIAFLEAFLLENFS